ncbi:hypothetical protein ACFQEX_13005 [Roseibium salinum]|uniref:hypothetical protein n=1 Tax=Roseibium salinum TaxID=1604349 RepID=UPI003614299A
MRYQTPEAQSRERSVEPEAEAPAATPSDDGVTRLEPSVAMDLEQNLTAELEDELIGAMRQSVHETADDAGYAEENQEVSVPAEHGDVFSSYPQTGHDEHGYGYDAATHRAQDGEPAGEATSIDTAPSRSEYPAPPVEHGVWRASVGAVPQQPRADQTAAPTSAPGRPRPTIDENDFSLH